MHDLTQALVASIALPSASLHGFDMLGIASVVAAWCPSDERKRFFQRRLAELKVCKDLMQSRVAWEALGGTSKDRIAVDVTSDLKVLTRLISHRIVGKELGPMDEHHAPQCVIDEMRVV